MLILIVYLSTIQRDQKELVKSVNRVHHIKDDDEEANEDKSDIGYISDVSTDDEMVGKGRKRLSNQGSKTGTPKKRKTASKCKEPPKKVKRMSKKQVRENNILLKFW